APPTCFLWAWDKSTADGKELHSAGNGFGGSTHVEPYDDEDRDFQASLHHRGTRRLAASRQLRHRDGGGAFAGTVLPRLAAAPYGDPCPAEAGCIGDGAGCDGRPRGHGRRLDG